MFAKQLIRSMCSVTKKLQATPNLPHYLVCRNYSYEGNEQRIEKTINQVTLLGRAGGEAKKGGSEERPVVYFSLATQVNYRTADTGEFTQKTDWHRVVIFKPSLRESVYNYLKKGQRIYVDGKLSYGEITDASGQTKPTTAIIADDIIFFNQNPK